MKSRYKFNPFEKEKMPWIGGIKTTSLSTQCYWCLGIPEKVIKAAVENSICFGVYKTTEGKPIQVGFARVVTDKATFAWLCDVYIEDADRGKGLSKWLMKCIMSYPELKNLRRFCLATKDAHALYEKFGFHVTQTPSYWMEIKDNDLYKKLTVEQKPSTGRQF